MGAPLSTGHMVSLTPDVPPPPSDQFHRNRLTMSDVFIRTARCSHVRPLRVNLTQYLSLASQETFVKVMDMVFARQQYVKDLSKVRF